jgi:hypothetical protein
VPLRGNPARPEPRPTKPARVDPSRLDPTGAVDGSCALIGVRPLDDALVRATFHGVQDSGSNRAPHHPRLRLVASATGARRSAPRSHAPRWFRITLVCRQRLIRKLAHASSLLSDGYHEPSIDHVVELAIDSLIALIEHP